MFPNHCHIPSSYCVVRVFSRLSVMNTSTLLRSLGLSLIVAGLGLSSTSVSAAGESTFKVTSLTTDNRVIADLGDHDPFYDDGGHIAITPSKVLLGFDLDASPAESAGVAYGLDLTSPAAADFAAESVVLVNDLADQSTYVFPAPDYSIASLETQFTWDEIVKLDASGNVASRISLNPAIVVASDEVSNETCVNVGSGNGVIGVWDLCTGTFWTIALPSGTVTSYTEGVADFLDYEDENLWPVYDFTETDNEEGQPSVSSGVLEYFDGAYHMLLPTEDYDGEIVSISRFSPFDPTASPEEVRPFSLFGEPGDEESPDLYSFAVSPSAGIWCAHTENSSPELFGDVSHDESIGCWDATFSTVLPSTGAGSAGTLVLGLGLVAAGAAVTVGSRRRRTA